MICGEKKLYRGNQPFHKKTLAGRMLAWSLKENTSWKNVTNLVFEMSGLAAVPPAVRLYQVKAEGFAWLSQCDRPCNAGLTLQKETAHRSTSQPSSWDNQQNDTLSWRTAGKQEKKKISKFGHKKAMASSCGCTLSLIPVQELSFLLNPDFFMWRHDPLEIFCVLFCKLKCISMGNAWTVQLSPDL